MEKIPILRIQFTVPTKLFARKYFGPFWPKLFTGPFSNPKISQNSYENRPKIGPKSLFWKHWSLIIEKSTKCWFWYSWIMKNHNSFTIPGTPFCFKMAKTYRKNTYMGYGSCTAMIVACSILIIIISKPRKIPTHKTHQQK